MEFSPSQRIYIEGVKLMSALQRFILEVLDGRRIHDRSVRKFDILSSILETHLVWWPLCCGGIMCVVFIILFSVFDHDPSGERFDMLGSYLRRSSAPRFVSVVVFPSRFDTVVVVF